MLPDVYRVRRISLVGRLGGSASWLWRQALCWLAGCQESEVVSLEPEVFGVGASGGMCHGVEARCPRCGRVEYRESTVVWPGRTRTPGSDE